VISSGAWYPAMAAVRAERLSTCRDGVSVRKAELQNSSIESVGRPEQSFGEGHKVLDGDRSCDPLPMRQAR